MRTHSRTLVNIGLLLSVAVAGAILYFRPEPAPAAAFALLPASIENMHRIEIERTTGMRIELVREHGQWRMQVPVAGRLDEIALARVLDIARAQSSQRLPATELARFELENPWARIRYDTHSVEFGMSNALTQEIYVRSGEHVHMLPARLAAGVPADPAKLLAHRLFGPDEHPVAFRLERFSLEQEGGRWRLEPGDGALSQDDLLLWVDQWRLASSIITQPQTDAPVRRSLEVELRDGRTIALRVTALAPDFVVRREDEQLEYHFPARLASLLLAAPGATAAKKP